jgi:hypothetical protein
MSNVDLLHGFDPTDTADTYGGREIVSFNYNIGKVTKVSAKTFDSGDTNLQVTVLAEEGPNKGNYASIRFPAAANLNEQIGGGWVAITDTEQIAKKVKAWQQALAAFLVAFKLPVPTTEQLSNDVLATDWLAAATDKRVVFTMYEDKKGYGAISCFPNKDTGKYHVGVRAADALARDRKGETIPGLTNEMQARQYIEKWIAKQGTATS